MTTCKQCVHFVPNPPFPGGTCREGGKAIRGMEGVPDLPVPAIPDADAYTCVSARALNPVHGLLTLTWNTGRTYTAHGQRIAAAALAGGVMMCDVDRGIRYFLPGCSLRVFDIMQRYDHNDRTYWGLPDDCGVDRLELVRYLEGLAQTVPDFIRHG